MNKNFFRLLMLITFTSISVIGVRHATDGHDKSGKEWRSLMRDQPGMAGAAKSKQNISKKIHGPDVLLPQLIFGL